MAGRKSDFTLPTLDDLFSTQELRDDAKLSKIRDIPLELIDDFPDHPFKVRDDEDNLNEATINEFGRFDELKKSVDKSKAKAFFEAYERTKLIPPKVNMKTDQLLRQFILTGGFEVDMP